MQLSAELHTVLENARVKHAVVTLVTGVFDVLHDEHHHFLEKAKALGEVLVIGIESDVRVRKIKGEGRPINTQAVRKKNLEDWGLANCVFILPEQFSQPSDHEELISIIRPRKLPGEPIGPRE